MTIVAGAAARTALTVALLASSVAGAAAFSSDRAAWLNYLQQERAARAPDRAVGTAPPAPAVAPTAAAVERPLPRGVLPMRGLTVAPPADPAVPNVVAARAPAAATATGSAGGVRQPSMAVETGRVLPRGVLPADPRAPAGTRTAAVRPITRTIDPQFLPVDVPYGGRYSPGTIVIDTSERYLYHVGPGGMARRYGVGVGRPGFQWAGTHRVSMKREWPGWTPPPQMRKRQPELPAFMEGGPDNPLGARALYLGSTLYRIHGSNAPWTIGTFVSSGCIRMRNEDVMELYERVNVGTKVVVLP